MKRQKKRYARVKFTPQRSFLVPKRFLDEWDDDEREDVIGQPIEQTEQGK